MVTARMVNNRMDKVARAQERRVLPSESSQTHLGRRGKTSITIRISLAIFKMTLFSSRENAFYDAILQREHHFYNNVARGATLANEI